jgi:hypothetical protein
MSGKTLDEYPEVLLRYELCKEFGWLPSQLDQEDNKTIEEFIVIMNAMSEHQSKESRKSRREALKNKHSGGQRR